MKITVENKYRTIIIEDKSGIEQLHEHIDLFYDVLCALGFSAELVNEYRYGPSKIEEDN